MKTYVNPYVSGFLGGNSTTSTGGAAGGNFLNTFANMTNFNFGGSPQPNATNSSSDGLTFNFDPVATIEKFKAMDKA